MLITLLSLFVTHAQTRLNATQLADQSLRHQCAELVLCHHENSHWLNIDGRKDDTNLAALSNLATAAFTLFVYECRNMMAGLL